MSSAALHRNVADLKGIAYLMKKNSQTVLRIINQSDAKKDKTKWLYWKVSVKVLNVMFDRLPDKISVIREDIGDNGIALAKAAA